MNKLNFCPYDFSEIDMDNLAYELTFPRMWSWKDVKEKTVVGTGIKIYISENDDRRDERFKKNTKTEHIILREHFLPGRKNGFKLLKEFIERENAKIVDECEKALEEMELEEGADYDDEFLVLKRQKMLFYNVRDGIDVFEDINRNIIIYAMPCCPHCHNRLPIGWDKAEDFGAVALMAPSGRGKTTFLLSMMNRNWEAFQELGGDPDSRHQISIAPAHLPHDEKDTTYYEMANNANEMCRKGGRCPDNTDRQHWIPPVFLKVQYLNHTMIIGIYDNAGEELRKMNLIENPNLHMLLDKMFAELYLFEPDDLNITLPRKREQNIKQEFKSCKLLPVEEQGKEQEENRGKKISGRDLIKDAFEVPFKSGDIKAALEVYYNYKNVLVQHDCRSHLEEMYFAGVIIKSDLLEHCEEIKSKAEYDILFQRGILDDMLDKDSMEMRNELVQKMIKELHLFGSKDIDEFKRDFGEIDRNGKPTGRQAVSWHCISALGCGSDGGKLQDEYAPIRVAEPLLTCILRRIADNGWMEE